jgi:hypothetical protein
MYRSWTEVILNKKMTMAMKKNKGERFTADEVGDRPILWLSKNTRKNI